jgi:hypothetical protein
MADETRHKNAQSLSMQEDEVCGGGLATAEVSRPRRPYAKPQLRPLGKVADLTFGSKGSASDAPSKGTKPGSH